jgi:hypothetical protein
MTFDQWKEAITTGPFLPSDDDPKVNSGIFEMVDEDLMEEES